MLNGVAGAGSARRLGESFAEATGNLLVRRQRSALALLGIMIGTASIVAMLNTGHVAQQETMRLFANMGVDIIQLRATPSGSAPPSFDAARFQALSRAEPGVVAAISLSAARASVRAGRRQADLDVATLTPELMAMANLQVDHGRALFAADRCDGTALLGIKAVEQLSAPAAAIQPGGQLGIEGYLFTIVGLLGARAPEPLDPLQYDNAVFVPEACARRVFASPDPNVALLRVAEGADNDAISADFTRKLASRHSAVQATDARALVTTMNAQKAVYSRLLAAIGGISLLVGGIGVMNVMLMSVLERRTEIGLRAAIGAAPADIRLLFLIEAAILAFLGGAMGTAFGVAISFAIAHLSGWTFDVALSILPVGPLGAGLIGLIFGFYPALAASRLNPIEALRGE